MFKEEVKRNFLAAQIRYLVLPLQLPASRVQSLARERLHAASVAKREKEEEKNDLTTLPVLSPVHQHSGRPKTKQRSVKPR